MTKKSTVSIVILAVLLFICSSNLYALGRKESDNETNNAIPNEQTFSEDNILSELIARQDKSKPSLEYLRAVTQAKNYLVGKDYYNAINSYTDLIVAYGENELLLYGLAETYFLLGDQGNSHSYFNQVIDLVESEKTQKNVLSDFEVKSYYRVAYLAYQKDEIKDYTEILSNIIVSAGDFDKAIVSVLSTESLDYMLQLFITPMDYSYIARRELGIYYMYTKVKEQETDSRSIPITSPESDATFFGAEEESDALSTFMNQEPYTQDEYLQLAQLYLSSALSMVVHSFHQYLGTRKVGYEFSDLSEMIELMKETEEGRDLLRSFDMTRILVGLRKYYLLDTTTNAEKQFYANYCTRLLVSLGYTEDVSSSFIYAYYPNLK